MSARKGRRAMSKWTAEDVRALRDAYGESQAQFVRRIPGLSVDALQNWEQGRGKVSPLGAFALDTLKERLNGHAPDSNGKHKRPKVPA